MKGIGLSVSIGIGPVGSGVPAIPTAPNAPTLGTITPGDTQLSCAFTLNGTGGSAITDVEYRLDGGAWTSGGVVSAPLVIGSLTNGTPYDIELRAVNAIGNSAASNLVSATPYTVPDAPTIDSVTAGDTTASIAFTAPVDDGGDAITDYEVRVDAGAWVSAGQTTSPIVKTGLTNFVLVSITLRAVNAAGASVASNAVDVTPTNAIPDATQSTTGFDSYDLPADGVTEVTAQTVVRDAGGTPLSGIPVTYEVLPCTVDGSASGIASSLTGDVDTDYPVIVTLLDNETGAPMPDIAAADIALDGDSGATISSFTGSTDANGQITAQVQWSTSGAKSITAPVLPAGANVSITPWTITISGGGGGTYPNEPAGLTPFGQFNGTPRATNDGTSSPGQGTGQAFGFSWMGPWGWDASRTEDESLIVTADVTNPTGSNDVLRFIWTPGDVTSVKSAKTDPATMPSTYDTLYIMLRIFWEADTWDDVGHKFFYVGLPIASTHFYATREPNGWGKITTEGSGLTGANDIVLPDGSFTDGVWNNIEWVCHAQSAPGVHDGAIEWYNNGSLMGSASNIDFGDNGFGTFEWYATNNSIPDVKHYRIGELYMSGA